MEPAGLVTATLKVLADAKVPPEAMAVAFGKVFDLLVKDTSPALSSEGRGDEGRSGAPVTPSLQAIAEKLGVDVAAVEQVYDYHGGELHLAVHPDKLAPSKSRATAEIAQLLAAGRQAIGLDESSTHVSLVREEAEHFKRYDQANFATTINSLSKVMTVRGSGRERTLKMTSPAWRAVTDLVRRLTEA